MKTFHSRYSLNTSRCDRVFNIIRGKHLTRYGLLSGYWPRCPVSAENAMDRVSCAPLAVNRGSCTSRMKRGLFIFSRYLFSSFFAVCFSLFSLYFLIIFSLFSLYFLIIFSRFSLFSLYFLFNFSLFSRFFSGVESSLFFCTNQLQRGIDCNRCNFDLKYSYNAHSMLIQCSYNADTILAFLLSRFLVFFSSLFSSVCFHFPISGLYLC